MSDALLTPSDRAGKIAQNWFYDDWDEEELINGIVEDRRALVEALLRECPRCMGSGTQKKRYVAQGDKDDEACELCSWLRVFATREGLGPKGGPR